MANSDGTITFNTELDNTDLEKEYQDVVKKIKKLENDLSETNTRKNFISEKIKEAEPELEHAKQQIDELKQKLAEIKDIKNPLYKGQRMSVVARYMQEQGDPIAQQISSQEKELGLLQIRYDELNAQRDKAAAKEEAITNSLDISKERAGELSQRLAEVSRNTTKAGNNKALTNMLDQARSKAERVLRRIQRLAERVMFFTVITQALRSIREYLGEVISQDEAAMRAINSLKGSLQALAMPIFQVVIPAFTKFVNILAVAVGYLARGVNAIFGTTIEKSIEAAKKMNASQKETAKNITNTGKAAKAASRYLAGFDELQLQSSGETSSSSAGSDLGDLDASNAQGINWDAFNEKLIDEKLQKIMWILAGALLAVGAILCFSGINIPLGITLMMIGALMMYGLYKENWNSMSDRLKKAITTALVIAGIVMVILGAILCFSGVSIPIGIGMIMAGAALMFAAAAVNWNSMSEPMRKAITEILTVVGIVAVVLGCILAFSGVNIPVGIALIVLGAASLVAAAALNWNTLGPILKENTAQLLSIVGVTALVIGILLCLTGVGVPFGIALILIGVSSLVGAVSLNWNFFKDRLSEIWDGIKAFWNEHIRPVFTVQWWADKAKAIAEGLKNGIKAGINGAIGLLNTFIGWVNDKLHLKWDAFSIGGKEIIPAVDYQLFKLPEIPKLARGAVIPPNREFAAVLGDQTSGTNIEAPENLIRSIIRDEMGGSELMNTLGSILDAVERGHVLMVDKRVLGQVANDQIRNMSRMGGYA